MGAGFHYVSPWMHSKFLKENNIMLVFDTCSSDLLVLGAVDSFIGSFHFMFRKY